MGMSVVPWYLFPWDVVKSTVPMSVYASAIRLVIALALTQFGILMGRLLKERQSLYTAPLHHPSHRVSFWWMREYLFSLFARSIPFAFTYQWTQLTYEMSF